MALTESSPRNVRLLTAVLLVLTFALGTATGAGIYHVAAKQGPRGPAGEPPPFPPLPLERLDLSAAQRDKIHEILEAQRPQFEEVVRATFPKLKALNAQIELKTREVLSVEQRKKLDKLLAERRAHPEPRPGLPPPSPPPPWGAQGLHPPPPGAQGLLPPPPGAMRPPDPTEPSMGEPPGDMRPPEPPEAPSWPLPSAGR